MVMKASVGGYEAQLAGRFQCRQTSPLRIEFDKSNGHRQSG